MLSAAFSKSNLLFYFFSFTIFLGGCSSHKQVSNSLTKIKGLHLQILLAKNLSEDWTVVSTQNDEILLLIHLLIPSGDTLVSQVEKTYSFTFDPLRIKQSINEKIFVEDNSLDKSIIAFTLIEMDNIGTEEFVKDKIRTYLHSGLFLHHINKKEIDHLLLDDDFLALKFIPLKELLAPKNISIEFSGMQLLDRFEYILFADVF